MSQPLLSAIYVYPVKSCAGIELDAAHLDTWGLRYDRNWLIVDEKGSFLTQRAFPRLALIKTALEPDSLRLTSPGMPEFSVPLAPIASERLSVTVWDDQCQAVDQGSAAAEWLSTFLETPCRLVRIGEGYDRPVEPDYISEPAQVSFADAYPLLVISEASLRDLNARLEIPLPMNRFRPNLVVFGCEPYAEDGWRAVRIGNATFRGVKLCERCAITTTDQATAERGKEPLVTLATYRRAKSGVVFGQNLVHTNIGEVRRGDAVEVLEVQS
ncbi:MOSC domain-containing protein [Leptolyngbya sp. FACHB-261]|uniref:MOSC domain-containing protein n=1 Tax=Leptolyngbya sp. FACHB-261 TaxID=2692806 RepID=UPI001687484A|nr:MOSC domain-containing protein [Leptolyngbya sp. FACHB-261]MBD2102296.1 MOSC domain-containing protein [Leptolyngbya sp. FACHB-261]